MEGTRRRGKTHEKMERVSRKRSSSAGREKMESWWQTGKNGRTLFERPKPTVGCSANGRRRRRRRRTFMRGIYNYIRATNHISKVHSVEAILQLQFVSSEVSAQRPVWLFYVVS